MRHGLRLDPPNRFERTRAERDLEQLAWDGACHESLDERAIEYLTDDSQSIVSTNGSPDVPFRFSVNPYRGCIHG